MRKRAEDIVEQYRQSLMRPGHKLDLTGLIEEALTMVSLEVRSSILDPIPCEQHPKYKGLRRPRALCEDCWRYYLARKDKDM